MRISDWSSVCSSDLDGTPEQDTNAPRNCPPEQQRLAGLCLEYWHGADAARVAADAARPHRDRADQRSGERRVGKECVSTCRSRWSPDKSKKITTEYTSPTPQQHRPHSLDNKQ